MKQFFKFFFASLLSFFVGLFLILLILGGIVAAAMSFGEEETSVKNQTILKMSFKEPIPDRASDDPFANFSKGSFEPSNQIGLDDILKNLKKAAKDDRIEGIYLEMTGLQAYMATVEEIRDALIEFKQSGKFIIAYGDAADQKAYYLASVADRIVMNPEGMFVFNGIQGQVMFLKGTLDKLGIEAQVIRHGKFKSAIEPLIQQEMSEANKEQVTSYISALWNHMIEGISVSRGVSVEALNMYADSMSLTFIEDAMKAGLVDDMKFRTDMFDELADSVGIEDVDDLEILSFGKYRKAELEDDDEEISRDKIAVIYAEGEIVDGEGEEGSVGGDKFAKLIREARLDEKVKAIVLRVNSPGGSGFASEIIHHEVLLAKAEKPVIASFGGVAASGGYYIACAADSILASPNTITGSIGVFGVIPNMQELFNDKLGLTFDKVMTNAHSDFMDLYRPMNEMERALLTRLVEDMYATFIGHVADGRGMTTEAVDEIGQGRVWAGANAININLVDKFGGLQEAIEMAASMAELESYRISSFPKMKDPFEKIMEGFTGSARMWMLEREMGQLLPVYEQIKRMEHMNKLQARMMYDITVN